jgi:hypothetical protein
MSSAPADLAGVGEVRRPPGRGSNGTGRASLVNPTSRTWAALLSRLPHDAHHLPEYAVWDARRTGAEAVAFLYEEGRSSLLLPLLLTPTGAGCSRDARSPSGFPGPLASSSDERFWSRAGWALRGVLEAAQVVSCLVRFHPFLCPGGDALCVVGAVVRQGETRSVELQRAPRSGRQVRGLPGGGRCTVWLDDWAQLPAVARLHQQSRAAAGRGSWRYDDFAGLRELLDGSAHLVVLQVDGRAAAAALLLELGGSVHLQLGVLSPAAGLPEARALAGATLRAFRQRGARRFHMAHGSDPLRKAFAEALPERHPDHTARIVLDEDGYDRLARTAGTSDHRSLTDAFPSYRPRRLTLSP